jgi:hypothetical protein
VKSHCEIVPKPVAGVDHTAAADHEDGVRMSGDEREQEDKGFDRIFAEAAGIAEVEGVCVGKRANGEENPK